MRKSATLAFFSALWSALKDLDNWVIIGIVSAISALLWGPSLVGFIAAVVGVIGMSVAFDLLTYRGL